jgi:hypothetical protein
LATATVLFARFRRGDWMASSFKTLYGKAFQISNQMHSPFCSPKFWQGLIFILITFFQQSIHVFFILVNRSHNFFSAQFCVDPQ